MNKEMLLDFLEEVETTEEYSGYYFSVGQALTITILGSLCGLKSVRQIHQWAQSEAASKLMKEKFAIERIPSYYWLLCLLKMVKVESLSRCLNEWARQYIPEERDGITIAIDGKTIRSTEKMKAHDRPLHIISAQLSELGITLGSKAVESKSNEIPAVRQLIEEMDIEGCLIVADALNCQKETAKAIVQGNGDYLLSVKANQPTLMQDISDYVHDESLRFEMDTVMAKEKNRDRIETRTAYITTDVSWLPAKDDWAKLACIGAIHTEFIKGDNKTDEWHYYISSRALSAKELLYHARKEWAVESMHWLLDVHFSEDYFRVINQTIQKNVNLLRKFALSIIKLFKQQTNSKKPMSQIMFDFLLNPNSLRRVFELNE